VGILPNKNICLKRLQEMGAYTPPAEHYPGSKFIHPIKDKPMRNWEKARDALWGKKGLAEE